MGAVNDSTSVAQSSEIDYVCQCRSKRDTHKRGHLPAHSKSLRSSIFLSISRRIASRRTSVCDIAVPRIGPASSRILSCSSRIIRHIAIRPQSNQYPMPHLSSQSTNDANKQNVRRIRAARKHDFNIPFASLVDFGLCDLIAIVAHLLYKHLVCVLQDGLNGVERII